MTFSKFSIRAKLSLIYTTVLLCLLVIFCGILYHSISLSLNKKKVGELERYAHKIAESYNILTKTFIELPENDFNPNPPYWFRIIKPDGTLYRPAPVFSIMTNTITLQAISKLQKDKPFSYEFNQSDQWFASIIYPIQEGYEFNGWIEVVLDVTEDKEMLSHILILMYVTGAVIIVFLFFSGRFLAAKTLNPVQEIRKQVDAIYEKNLSLRIHAPNSYDEIGQLAKTFNQMLNRIETAFEQQKQLIADASHELKTPIAILRSQWENLSMQNGLDRKLQEKIICDIEELAHLSKLISDLLFLSTPEKKLILSDYERIDLSLLFVSLIEDIKVLAQPKMQNVNILIQDNLFLHGDKSLLNQLFLNIADNAIKYTPEKGTLEIQAEKIQQNISISFTDNGIGISPEHLPFIFERFYRVDKSRSRKTGGFGLGLSICKTITEVHNGTITVNSHLGAGTKVIVLLPSTD